MFEWPSSTYRFLARLLIIIGALVIEAYGEYRATLARRAAAKAEIEKFKADVAKGFGKERTVASPVIIEERLKAAEDRLQSIYNEMNRGLDRMDGRLNRFDERVGRISDRTR